LLAFPQSVKVKKESLRILGNNAEGYEVVLEASEDEVKTSLAKFLKTAGKIRQSDDVTTISEPVIEGKKFAFPLYATTRQVGNLSSAWVGVNPTEWGKSAASVEKDLETFLYDFGVSFYRGKIQLQIDESQRALQIVEKQQLRLVNQNKDLVNKIENNKKQKIQLEKSLVANKQELETLTQNIEQNKKGQDSIALATDQIKKVVEMHRESQRKVH
jgi:hypothetical protein